MESVEYISHICLCSEDDKTDFYVPGLVTEYRLLRSNSFLRDYCRELPVGTRVFVKYRCFHLTFAETGDACCLRRAGKGTFSFVKTH